MNHDFLLSLLLAVCFHVAMLFGNPWNTRPVRMEPREPIVQILPPPLETPPPPPPKPTTTTDDPAQVAEEFDRLASKIADTMAASYNPGDLFIRIDRPDRVVITRDREIYGIPSFKPDTTAAVPEEIIDAVLLDQKPDFQVPPVIHYPFALKRNGLTGSVEVYWVVDENGEIHDIQVLASSHPAFTDAVLRGLQKARMIPGLLNGKTVRFRMSQKYDFHIDP